MAVVRRPLCRCAKSSSRFAFVGITKYQIKRATDHQELIRARRDMAYKRQMSMERSLPEARAELRERAASTLEAQTEAEVEEGEGEGVVTAEGSLTA